MPETISAEAERHPIIFNARSIRAILRNEKTQTRRIVKPQPPSHVTRLHGPEMYHPARINKEGKEYPTEETFGIWHEDDWDAPCPYGRPGDVLMVREAFRLPEGVDDMSPSEYVERLQVSGKRMVPRIYEADEKSYLPTGYLPEWGRLRPSIHMPYDLVRLRLRVEEIRVERIQDISGEDALAEGLEYDKRDKVEYKNRYHQFAVSALARMWNDIHGDGAWARNDWVFVLTFSRINAD